LPRTIHDCGLYLWSPILHGTDVADQLISNRSLLGLSFTLLNTWSALASCLQLSLSAGGPSVAIWGLLVSGFFSLCLSSGMAEFASVYPRWVFHIFGIFFLWIEY
jgi:hypothetical protein